MKNSKSQAAFYPSKDRPLISLRRTALISLPILVAGLIPLFVNHDLSVRKSVDPSIANILSIWIFIWTCIYIFWAGGLFRSNVWICSIAWTGISSWCACWFSVPPHTLIVLVITSLSQISFPFLWITGSIVKGAHRDGKKQMPFPCTVPLNLLQAKCDRLTYHGRQILGCISLILTLCLCWALLLNSHYGITPGEKQLVQIAYVLFICLAGISAFYILISLSRRIFRERIVSKTNLLFLGGFAFLFGWILMYVSFFFYAFQYHHLDLAKLTFYYTMWGWSLVCIVWMVYCFKFWGYRP